MPVRSGLGGEFFGGPVLADSFVARGEPSFVFVAEFVAVGAAVNLTLLDEALVCDGVEVGVAPSVIDFLPVGGFEFGLDLEAVGFVETVGDCEEVALESG